MQINYYKPVNPDSYLPISFKHVSRKMQLVRKFFKKNASGVQNEIYLLFIVVIHGPGYRKL